MTDERIELKPCPFCGEAVTLKEASENLMVIVCGTDSTCIGSGVSISFLRRDTTKAIAAWNTRDTMDRLVAEGQRCDAMTPQEAAKVLLAAVDAFMSGEKLTEEQRELERTAVIAGAFAGGAYDRYWPKGGGEYHALTRVFLLALIDPDHAELDYLRTDPSAGQTARDARAALRAISEGSHE